MAPWTVCFHNKGILLSTIGKNLLYHILLIFGHNVNMNFFSKNKLFDLQLLWHLSF